MPVPSLTSRRESLGLDHAAVAAKSGLSSRTIYRLEEECRLPVSIAAQKGYAAALEISRDELIEMVARERKARGRRHGASAKVVGRRVHEQVSCPKHAARPARRPGQVGSSVPGATGGRKSGGAPC
jgi:transcriptional regulator with XRE-family HTH domain